MFAVWKFIMMMAGTPTCAARAWSNPSIWFSTACTLVSSYASIFAMFFLAPLASFSGVNRSSMPVPDGPLSSSYDGCLSVNAVR